MDWAKIRVLAAGGRVRGTDKAVAAAREPAVEPDALAEHERLAGALMGAKGRFLLSVNAAPEIAALYPGTTVEEVTTKYTVSRRKVKDGKPLPRTTELLIRNY